jgi:hypothetical protein
VGHLFEPELIALLILSLTLVPIFILISPLAKQEDKGEPRGPPLDSEEDHHEG